jgi:hypothetical protein
MPCKRQKARSPCFSSEKFRVGGSLRPLTAQRLRAEVIEAPKSCQKVFAKFFEAEWSAFFPSQSRLHAPVAERKNWLSDMDSNHDKGLQRALCYHYTIGQARLEIIARPKSCKGNFPGADFRE